MSNNNDNEVMRGIRNEEYASTYVLASATGEAGGLC